MTSSYHPSDFVHGLFAAHVYNSCLQWSPISLEREEWLGKTDAAKEAFVESTLRKWHIYHVIDDTHQSGSGYYGHLYANHEAKQLVLAHRGSQNLKSFYEDYRGVALKTKSTPFQLECFEAVKMVSCSKRSR